MSFIDERLPVQVERGVTGGPGFKTTVLTTLSGREQRNKRWQKARGQWDVGYGIMSDDDFNEVQRLFYVANGKANYWRFKDWGDFEATDQALGTGDGVEDAFNLIKVYTFGAATYTRFITHPIESTIVMKVNGVVDANWTLGANGVVTFDTPPGDTLPVTASFEFDVPVRFDTDEFRVTLEMFNAGSIPSLPIIEVRI